MPTGLKRELKVVVGQGELTQRFATRLDEVKDQVQLKGFRKGKVPVAHLKKLYGRSVMAEVLQQTVDETSRKAISERNERPAQQPNINLTEDKDEIERVLPGRATLPSRCPTRRCPSSRLPTLPRSSSSARWPMSPTEAVDKAIADLRRALGPLRGRGGPRRR